MDSVLGVDLGTTYTAASATNAAGKPEMVGLGNRTAEIPSVLLYKSDGEFLVGEPAERRAFGEPERVARQFKRRLGDATPLLLGGSPFSPEALQSRLLRWVVNRAEEQRGTTFAATVICHPANYGPYRMELLGQAAKMAELDNVYFVPEPVAAAVHYADQARSEPGEIVVVYDFGGGTFDVAVLRRTEEAFEVVGTPAGLEHLGGLDLDEAVFGHVVSSVGAALTDLDPTDPAVVAAVGRLRDECKAAKEALSSDTDTSIPVLLPGVQTEVRLTRSEFEAMILPSVLDTVSTTTRAIRDAGCEASEVGRILLVGGSARVPLVSQLLTEELGRPTVVDAHPKHAIALGAARWGAIEVEGGGHGASAAEAPMVAVAAAAVDTDAMAPAEPPPAAPAEPPPTVVEPEVVAPTAAHTATAEPPPTFQQPVQSRPSSIEVVPRPAASVEPIRTQKAPAATKRRFDNRTANIILGLAALVLVAAIAYAVTQSGGGGGGNAARDVVERVVAVDGDTLGFTDTEIDVKVGDRITITATGEVSHNEDEASFTDPDGVKDPTTAEALKIYNVVEDVRHNALIGKIGNGDGFNVGKFATFRAEAAGRLFLGVNDTGRPNNAGMYNATVKVEPA